MMNSGDDWGDHKESFIKKEDIWTRFWRLNKSWINKEGIPRREKCKSSEDCNNEVCTGNYR